MVEFLDCCELTELLARRILLDTTHESEVLHECQKCGAWWFYRYFEIVSYDGDDRVTQWYNRINGDQAAQIMAEEGRVNLDFLAGSPGFRIEGGRVSPVEGQPSYPFYG